MYGYDSIYGDTGFFPGFMIEPDGNVTFYYFDRGYSTLKVARGSIPAGKFSINDVLKSDGRTISGTHGSLPCRGSFAQDCAAGHLVFYDQNANALMYSPVNLSAGAHLDPQRKVIDDDVFYIIKEVPPGVILIPQQGAAGTGEYSAAVDSAGRVHIVYYSTHNWTINMPGRNPRFFFFVFPVIRATTRFHRGLLAFSYLDAGFTGSLHEVFRGIVNVKATPLFEGLYQLGRKGQLPESQTTSWYTIYSQPPIISPMSEFFVLTRCAR